jgi:hypothetical protein
MFTGGADLTSIVAEVKKKILYIDYGVELN